MSKVTHHFVHGYQSEKQTVMFYNLPAAAKVFRGLLSKIEGKQKKESNVSISEYLKKYENLKISENLKS